MSHPPCDDFPGFKHDWATALTTSFVARWVYIPSFSPLGALFEEQKQAHILLNQFGLSEKATNGRPPYPVEKDKGGRLSALLTRPFAGCGRARLESRPKLG